MLPNTLIADLNGKIVIMLEAGQSDMPLMQYFLQYGIEVKVKNINYLSSGGVFGNFIYQHEIEQLPPNYFTDHHDVNEILISGEGYASSPKEPDNASSVTTELQLLLQYCKSKVVMVTGSFGKQTTTALISEIMERSGFNVFRRERHKKTVLCSLEDDFDYLVMDVTLDEVQHNEISSAALVITNLSPYPFNPNIKFIDLVNRIVAHLNSNRHQMLVLNDDNYFCKIIDKKTTLTPCCFSYKRSDRSYVTFLNGKLSLGNEAIIDNSKEGESFSMYGNRNLECYLAAVAAVSLLYPDVNNQIIKESVLNFKGADGHMEFVGFRRGRKYFNNLYSTSPAQTVAALTTLKENVILITGGIEKNINFKALAMEIVYFCKVLILVGKASTEIKRAVESYHHYHKDHLPIFKVANVTKAVQLANHLSTKGDMVLLSYSSHDSGNKYPFLDQRSEFVAAISSLV